MKFDLYDKEVADPLALGDREWIAESVKKKENLVITIGDSWTWGDSLGISATENNRQYRYKNFYTSLLANKLDADWLMLAQCGTNNRWILARYIEVCDAISKGYYNAYNKVFVHVNFTEQFRDIQGFNYESEISHPGVNNFAKYYFETTILHRMRYFTKKIDVATKYHTFGQNFWNFEFDKPQNWLSDVWQDLIFAQQGIDYRVKTPMVSNIAINPFTEFCKKNQLGDLFDDFKEQTKSILELIEYFGKSEYNSARATKHPLEKGHLIWSDYLYDHYSKL